MIQRGDIRKRANPHLRGDGVTDCLKVKATMVPSFNDNVAETSAAGLLLWLLRPHPTGKRGRSPPSSGEDGHCSAAAYGGHELRPTDSVSEYTVKRSNWRTFVQSSLGS